MKEIWMKLTDTSEKGLEKIIVDSLVYAAEYELGESKDYDREHAVDLNKLIKFFKATQPKLLDHLNLEEDGPKRIQFLHRLQGEIAKRGIVDILRKGIKHGPVSIDFFYGTPTPGNSEAMRLNYLLIWHCLSTDCLLLHLN